MNNEPTREEFAARLDAHEGRIEARLATFETDFTKFEGRVMQAIANLPTRAEIAGLPTRAEIAALPTRAEIRTDLQWIGATAAGISLAVVAAIVGGIQWLDARREPAPPVPIVIQMAPQVAPTAPPAAAPAPAPAPAPPAQP